MKKQTSGFSAIWLVFFLILFSSCTPSAPSLPANTLSATSPPTNTPFATTPPTITPTATTPPTITPSASMVPTLAFENNQCNYDGPSTLPSDFTLTWNINDGSSSEYAYVVITLHEDKTLNDLKESLALSPNQPEFINIISRDYSYLGNTTMTKEHNLAANGLYRGEPIYFICFFGDVTDAIGPITIKD